MGIVSFITDSILSKKAVLKMDINFIELTSHHKKQQHFYAYIILTNSQL